MNLSDPELLRLYVEEKSETAFAELVRRNFDLVYCAASRQVAGDAELARDVAQTVFVDLARKARSLAGRTSLAGWLYTGTHFAAANAVRSEKRRRVREQAAVANQDVNSGSDLPWERLGPALDSAMQELDEQDREAVLLRFFARHELRKVGAALAVSEDAARKRVERALDKLRVILRRQGLTSTAATLAAVLTGQAVTAAPAGAAAAVTQAALASLASCAPLTFTAFQAMTLTKPQLLGLTTLMLAIVSVPVYLQHQVIRELRTENVRMRQLAARSASGLSPAVAPAEDSAELQRLRRDNQELLRLRAEVSRLRQQVAEIPPPRPPPALPPAPERKPEEFPEPVQIFVANTEAVVPVGQMLAFGGWATPPGKRTLVFVQPRIIEPRKGPLAGSIYLESRFVEIPDDVLTETASALHLDALERLRSEGKASSMHSLFSSDEAALLLKTLENTAGVQVLQSPRAQTLEGRQAVVSATEQKTVGGLEHTLGPVLDLEPRIAADGSSVILTVSARLKKETPP